MSFVLSRVDDRAIHGQTVTMWSKVYQNNGIILVDDGISNDPIMRKLYKSAAIGTSVYIFNLENAKIKGKQAQLSEKKYILIARNPIAFKKLIEEGIDIGKKLVIGPVPAATDRKQYAQFTFLNEEEAAACDFIAAHGVDVVIQDTPSSKVTSWQEAIRKQI